MEIRPYTPDDCAEIADLFYGTVHSVNAKHYTSVELNAWATGAVDLQAWNASFLSHHTLVATENSAIVGFADMNAHGHLERLYVHKHHQRRGIATTLVNKLEDASARHGTSAFTTHASITALPFFLHCGYTILKEQHVERFGVFLTNYAMQKHLLP